MCADCKITVEPRWMRRGVFIQPEVGLPPGFALPDARLREPEEIILKRVG